MKSNFIFVTCLSVITLLAACSHVPPATVAAPDPVQAAWVVVGEQGQATARVITQASYCPDLIQDGVAAAMQVRALPATIAQRPVAAASSAMSSDKPASFPVLTCEAVLQPGVASASVAGRSLPVPKAVPLKILVLGDTGCRLKAEAHYFQACNDAAKWAFATVAKTAAGFAPDLVIHVGDYQYRESPCPSGIAACTDSPWGFGWDTWQADFFAPGAPLLAAAPWVMARGNHESCARAGQGWWRFLDPRAPQAGRDCNLASNDMRGDYSAPYAVPLGAGAQLIVFDSSKAAGKPLAKNDPAYLEYQQEFRQVDRLASQAPFSIFIEHHPILGFAPERGKTDGVEVRPGNPSLQGVLSELHPQRLFAPNVQLLLAGHVHLFEALTFSSDHPMQLVTGNGGSSPDVDLPNPLPPTLTPFEFAVVDHFNSTSRSGFSTMERASASATDWTIKSWDQFGMLMTTCTVSRQKQECH